MADTTHSGTGTGISKEASISAAFASVKNILLVIGGIMAANGLASSGLYFWLQIVTGSIMVVGPALWTIYTSFQDAARKRIMEARAVQAGINLTVSGNALAEDGVTLINVSAGSTPPKPVTLATAAEIIKTFGPALHLIKIT